jgi:isopentenyl phosphate kinase
MLTFIKLGGSLITDKKIESSYREPVMERLAREIDAALRQNSDLQILLGHGSGSFGHFAAKRYRTIEGVHTAEEWRGFAQVATVAGELSNLVAKTLNSLSVPVWRIQPSASALSRDGMLVNMAISPIETALAHGLVPLVYGDVGLDEALGGTILSTEKIFFYLAHHVPVQQILLLGEVEGVYDQNKQVIPQITPANLPEVEKALGGSAGTDVTGGMETKVQDMLALTREVPGLTIRIIDGTQPDLLRQTLLGEVEPGTLITAG